jgi:hypothetical protein
MEKGRESEKFCVFVPLTYSHANEHMLSCRAMKTTELIEKKSVERCSFEMAERKFFISLMTLPLRALYQSTWSLVSGTAAPAPAAISNSSDSLLLIE